MKYAFYPLFSLAQLEANAEVVKKSDPYQCLRGAYTSRNGEVYTLSDRDLEYLIPTLPEVNFIKVCGEGNSRSGYGVGYLRFANHTPKGKLFTFGFEGENKEEYLKVIEKSLLPHVEQDVIFFVPHQRVTYLVEDTEQLVISVWTGLKCSESRTATTMWGQKVSCTDRPYLPTGLGTIIYDDKGTAVAELIGNNNLIIYHDLVHHGDAESLKILELILGEVVKMRIDQNATPEKKLAYYQGLFVAKCKKTYDGALDEATKRHEALKVEVATLSTSLVAKIKARTKVEKEVAALSNDTTVEVLLAREFKAICDHTLVASLQIKNNKIVIVTKPIRLIDPRSKKTHEIGRMQLEIDLNTGISGITITNLDRTIVGYNSYDYYHPHVQKSGSGSNICWGNLKDEIPRLIGKYQFGMVVQLVLELLSTLNLENDNWTPYVTKFPVVEEVVAVDAKPNGAEETVETVEIPPDKTDEVEGKPEVVTLNLELKDFAGNITANDQPVITPEVPTQVAVEQKAEELTTERVVNAFGAKVIVTGLPANATEGDVGAALRKLFNVPNQ